MNSIKYEKIIDISKNIVTGKTPSTKDEENFSCEYPFITPSDIPSYYEKYITKTERGISTKGSQSLKGYMLPKDSICVVCIGSTIGKMCYTTTNCFTNQQINSVVPKDEYNPNYLFYLIRYIKGYFQLIGGGTGSGKGIVNKTTFGKIKLPILDDRKAQDKIASILSTYDDLIEKNNRKIEILQEMAEELYKEWFVRFRFPGYKTVKFVDGIPEGWQYKPFSEVVNYERGLSYSSAEIDCEDGINLINLKNINSYGGFRLDGTKTYNGKYKESQVVKYGDLIMGVTDMTQDRRTVGAVALVPYFENTCVISADLIKLISSIDNTFIYCLCKYGYYSKFFSQFANGSNVLHLKPSSLRNQKVLMPTDKLIDTFVKIARPINESVNNLNRQNDMLKQQRDLLLPRLMSGKLEVKGDAHA